MTARFLFAFVISCSVLAAPGFANWPHWRGENGNGVSTTATPPTEWSETKNVRWKVNVPGRGSGSPIVWQDRVFVVSAVDAGEPSADDAGPLKFDLFCFDRSSGDQRWRRTTIKTRPYGGAHHTSSFASASPCTDGEYVYAHFGSQGLYCYTLDGEPVWNRDLGDMTTRMGFGEGSSPTIAGDALLVPWDHEGPSSLVALDKRTGEILWRTPRDEPTNWATPLVVEHAGRKQVILNGENCARAYDLERGQELWRCGGQTERPVASAVAADGLVFIGSGHRGSFLGAFRLDGRGDIQGTSSVAWSLDRDTPDIPSPVLSAGRLYFFKHRRGLVSCFDAASGRPHFTNERVNLGDIYASPVAAGGHVYLTDRQGTTVVIKDADEFQVVAENSVGETVDATPAPVDNELFIRGEYSLFCISTGGS